MRRPALLRALAAVAGPGLHAAAQAGSCGSGRDPAWLTAVGRGRRQIFDTANPYAASNRRVRVIRIEE